MFELHVAASPGSWSGSRGTSRLTISSCARLMVRTVHELQDAGVEPDVWKVEGMDRREDCVKVVAARGGTAGIEWAASSWVAARTSRRSGSG